VEIPDPKTHAEAIEILRHILMAAGPNHPLLRPMKFDQALTVLETAQVCPHVFCSECAKKKLEV